MVWFIISETSPINDLLLTMILCMFKEKRNQQILDQKRLSCHMIVDFEVTKDHGLLRVFDEAWYILKCLPNMDRVEANADDDSPGQGGVASPKALPFQDFISHVTPVVDLPEVYFFSSSVSSEEIIYQRRCEGGKIGNEARRGEGKQGRSIVSSEDTDEEKK